MKKEFDKELVLDKVYDVANNIAVVAAGSTVIGHVAKCKPVQVVGAAVTFAALITEKIAGQMAFNHMIDEAIDEEYFEKMVGEDDDEDLFDEDNFDDTDDVHETVEQISEESDDEENLLAKMAEEEIANAQPIDPNSVG